MKRLACLMLIAVGSPAVAADWEYVTTDSDNADIYVDRSSIVETAVYKKAWYKSDHSKDKTTTARSKIVQIEVRCADRTMRTVGGVVYFPNGRSESVSETYLAKPIIPDSIGNAMADAVCK